MRCSGFVVWGLAAWWIMLACALAPQASAEDVLTVRVRRTYRGEYKLEPRTVRLVLKPRSERQRMLEEVFWQDYDSDLFRLIPRPDLDPQHVEAARTRARLEVPHAMPISEGNLRTYRFKDRRRRYVMNTLGIVGEASDAALLLKAYRKLVGYRVQWPEGRNLMWAIAQLEARLGILRSGELVRILENRQPHAAKYYWGVEAALQLRRFGLDLGTEVLVSHLVSPLVGEAAYQHDPRALWALLGEDTSSVRNAQRTRLAAAIDKEGGLLLKDRGIPVPGTIPAMLGLVALGDANDRVLLENVEISVDHLAWLELLCSNAHEVRAAALACRPSLGLMAQSAGSYLTLPERQGRAAFDDLVDTAQKAWDDRKRANKHVSPVPYGLVIRLHSAPLWPSPVVAEAVAKLSLGVHRQGDPLPHTRPFPWMPVPNHLWYMLGTWHVDLCKIDFERQLSHFDTEVLRKAMQAQFAEHWKEAYLGYLEWHAVSLPSFRRTQGVFPGEGDYEPFALRHEVQEAGWQGAVVGGVTHSVSWVDDALRVEVGVRQAGQAVVAEGHEATAKLSEAFERLTAAGGVGVISSVTLMQRGQPVRLRRAGASPGGSTVYFARPGSRDFAETYLVVRLRFFDATRVVCFPLYLGRAARTLRRAQSRALRLHEAYRADPSDVDTFVAYADALAAQGRLSEAEAVYLSAVARGADAEWTLRKAAGIYEGRKLYTRAAKLLFKSVRAFPEAEALWNELGRVLYLGGRYGASLRATEGYRARHPEDVLARYRAAACLFLSGDAKSANAQLEQIPRDFAVEHSGLLRYVVERSLGTRSADELAAELQTLRASRAEGDPLGELCGILLDTPFEFGSGPASDPGAECRRRCYAGYRAHFAGDLEQARLHFTRAVETRRYDLLEYRLAGAALDTLKENK